CWSHARRGFYELADIAAKARRGSAAVVSPIALEAVKRIDAIFAIEREINGRSPEDRVQARQEASKPLVDELAIWL
ncbi:IS66 family transposase, partial [Klebsiella pneumoniae]|uniref:IS66 family transposase n=1 Tax=Klebsiella pneumoniae TaxID=573 RepID=UPI0013D6BC7D